MTLTAKNCDGETCTIEISNDSDMEQMESVFNTILTFLTFQQKVKVVYEDK